MSPAHVLSLSRVLAAPAVAALILARPGDAFLIAAAVFSVASFTDLVDGKLARYSQQVSPLGIFLDTTSDKVLVALTLIAMSVAGLTAAWIPLIIIGREFLISGLRSFAASQDKIISAHIWGKGKTAVTMVAIPAVLVAAAGRAQGAPAHLAPAISWGAVLVFTDWLLAVSALLTIVSGVRYVVDAWPLFRRSAVAAVPRPEERSRRTAGHDG